MRAVRAAIGLLALSLLAGCGGLPATLSAQVPTTGPIKQGEQVGVEQEDQFIRVIAREPRPGMTPTQIVQGFLDASASFDGDHAVAREYLTKGASTTWKPGAGVSVYEGAPGLTEFGNDVLMNATQTGAIAPNGRFQASGPTAELHAMFHLVEVDGQWRIADVPPGLLLARSDVDRAFRSFAVYFFNPTFETLVPDPRLIPVIGSGVPTALLRELVSGPSDWLEPAVRTGFPAGVSLNIDSVPVDNGIAHVDLSANARQADDQTRRAMSQQIVWTLRQLPDVKAVDITAGGQPLVVPGAPSPQTWDAWPGVDPDAVHAGSTGYVARPEGTVTLQPDFVQPVPGAAGTGETDLVDIAVSSDMGSIAGVDSAGAVWMGRLVEGSPLIKVRDAGQPSSLAYDRSAGVWVVDAGRGLYTVSGDGTVDPISVKGLPGKSTLVGAFPSRDGTRAALIVRRGGRSTLLLARIVRTAGASSRITVDAPVRVESKLVEVVDLAWSGADTLTVLGSESAGTLQVFDLDLARNLSTSRGTPAAPLSVASAPGLPLLVGAADGLVYEFSAGTWTERVRGTSPTYPG